MSDVDLAQLRALVAVVDEGSFDAAARALHLTPSAVSQRIKSLEQLVGQVLVQRTKPTAATEVGRTYVRLARQVGALVHDARAAAAPDDEAPVTLSLAINADSLDTWVLPSLVGLAGAVSLDLHREDEAHSADLLRSGTVLAAITSDAEAVQGCRSTRLGTMRYRPMASPTFLDRWFAGGVDASSLGRAPVVILDRKDDLQDRYLSRRSRKELSPPRHHVPASTPFLNAVLLGFGWGMLPDQQASELEAEGRLVEFDRGQHLGVTLYWQQWTHRMPTLDRVAAAIREGAAAHLT